VLTTFVGTDLLVENGGSHLRYILIDVLIPFEHRQRPESYLSHSVLANSSSEPTRDGYKLILRLATESE